MKQRGKPRAKVEISLRDYDNLNQNNFLQQSNKIKLKIENMVIFLCRKMNVMNSIVPKLIINRTFRIKCRTK